MSRSKRASIQIAPLESPIVLDPCTLGRPFHLLDIFRQRFRERLNGYLADHFNHQYGAALSVGAVSIISPVPGQSDASWLGYRSSVGPISFRVDRRLLLTLLDYRYGEPLKSTPAAAIDLSSPATETERRLAVTIGLDLVETLTSCIDSASIAADTTPALFEPASSRAPATGDQLICTAIEDTSREVSGKLEFALSEAWLTRLFNRTSSPRVTTEQATAPETPLATQINVTLYAQLLTREIALGEFLDLVPGDVIPVHLNTTADILVNGSRLYTASVVQHDGKFWLTSFESAEQNMVSSTDDLGLDAVLDSMTPETAETLGATPEAVQPQQPRGNSMQILRRIPVKLTLEVGSATLMLSDLMALEAGSTVELDSLVGEPLTMKVNGTPVGHAEVVVSGQSYGLRVVDLVDLKTLAS